MPKGKPCAVPLCPALRAKGSFTCVAHKSTKPPREHKYRAVATTIDGIHFASRAEARRYQELRLMQKAGVIANLNLQTRWPLMVNGVVVCHYVSDFDYEAHGIFVVEDAKGVATPVYRLKAKMFAAQYGYAITEVR